MATSQATSDVSREGRAPPLSKAKILIFLAAGLSLAMSVALFFTGSREQGIYVGIWVPSILSAGVLLLGRTDG